MLGYYGRCNRLHHLDSFRQYLRLPSYPRFLDERTAFQVHQPVCHVVHECSDQYCHGLCNYHPSHAGHSETKSRAKTEAGTNRNLCCWRVVSASLRFFFRCCSSIMHHIPRTIPKPSYPVQPLNTQSTVSSYTTEAHSYLVSSRRTTHPSTAFIRLCYSR